MSMSVSRQLLVKFRKYNRSYARVLVRCVCSSSADARGYVCKELEDGYVPHVVERGRYDVWEREGRFTFKGDTLFSNKHEVFSMVLPPPNITGNLHLGHALTTTLQDVVARWKRMKGFKVLFLPGTDHAGIATQVVVEKYLKKKGIDRHKLGKEEFRREVWKWKEEHGTNIQQQLRRLGASLDWSREVFTLNDKQTEAVKLAFVECDRLGLLYRDNRLVNWSCALRSTISDMEVETLTVHGPTYVNVPGYSDPVQFGFITKVAYKLCDGDEEIVVATTRPETMLGDAAIAVHPDDERYKHLVYRHVIHPLLKGKTIPIIADGYVDPDYGTGAVKITPAHDRSDYEVAQRHSIIGHPVIDETGCMYGRFPYLKMPRYIARQKILEDLKEKGLLRDHSPHSLTLPLCSRTGDVVELLPRTQWFLDCKEMAGDLIESTEKGDLKIIPNHHETVWCNWLSEERDWCLSRQLWWGHDIPAYWTYPEGHQEEGEWVAGVHKQDALNIAMDLFDCDSFNLTCKQDPDVLDTWFSSGVYPFSSLGWPTNTSDYKHLYPLSLMITGYDIMCLWVMRMTMLGSKLTGKLPFPKVLLHGIITDAYGAKMSKSKGNVINPVDVIDGASLGELDEKSIQLFELGTLTKKELKAALDGHRKQYPNGIPECGADALRFTLCEVNPKNQLITFNVSKCYTNKLFGNKIWQSIKYFQNCHNISSEHGAIDKCTKVHLQQMDLWLLSRLNHLVETVNNSLEEFDFHIAVGALKKFLYEEMCDIYIECTKQTMKSDLSNETNRLKLAAHCHVFSVCYNTALRCLAPFMPHLIEELIPAIPRTANMFYNFNDTLENLTFPENDNYTMWANEILDGKVKTCMNIISVIRQLRHTFSIESKIHPIVHIESEEKHVGDVINGFRHLIMFIAKCQQVELKRDDYKPTVDISSYHHEDNCKIYLEFPNTDEMIEKIKIAKGKLVKKREKLLKNLNKLEKVVNDKKFVAGASEESKNDHMLRIKEIKDDLQKIEHLQRFG